MDVQNIFIFGTIDNPLRKEANTLFAKVIVIDKTGDQLKFPPLYQVKDYDESANSIADINAQMQFSDDVFVLVGHVSKDKKAIDKKLKRIQLSNEDIVEYEHLIIVGGDQQDALSHDQLAKFLPGLCALGTAPRVQKSADSPMHMHEVCRNDKINRRLIDLTNSDNPLNDILRQHALSADIPEITTDEKPQVAFEVQR